MSKVSVLGAGGWGLALSLAALHAGNSVTVWSPFAEEVKTLLNDRESRLLSGVKIPSKVKITDDLSSIVGSDITMIATPSVAVRETAARIKGLDCGIIVNVSKGIEYGTLYTLLQVIEEELPDAKTASKPRSSHRLRVERLPKPFRTLCLAINSASIRMMIPSALNSAERLRILSPSPSEYATE